MLMHTYVVVCLTLNPTLCREIELVPWDFSGTFTVTDCGRLGFTYSGNYVVDREGAEWTIKGVHCRREGSMLPTDLQAYLRSRVAP